MATQKARLTRSAIASREYRKAHPNEVRRTTAKYNFNKYMEDYAELDGLNELLGIVKERRQTLKEESQAGGNA